MAKSAQAFRTIGEVAEALDTPAHVLRFWESKFSQVRPVKRAGGRRYYRPEDLELLGGIKMLLHDQGMTIKGVQKLLREKGVRHVAGQGREERVPAETQAPASAAGNAAEIEDAVLVLDPPPAAVCPAETGVVARPRQEVAPSLMALLREGAPRLAGRADRLSPLLSRLESLRDRLAAARAETAVPGREGSA